MIGSIKLIDFDQFNLLLSRSWVRRIAAVHIHHTWRPKHAQWRGQATVEAIRRYHVQSNGWSDIAQHLTLGPDGSLWTGRSLERAPASVAGHNGTAEEGPFMIEMCGDFDAGQDAFAGAQAEWVYRTVAAICKRFGLTTAAIRFHNEFTNLKTCPGTSLKLADFRAEVGTRMGARGFAVSKTSDATRAYVAALDVGQDTARALDIQEDEPRYDAMQAAQDWSGAAAGRGLGASFSAEDIEVFKSHVVNLSGGQLSQSGLYANTEADLDTLIARLAKWVDERKASPGRVVFYAHGGLVDEKKGLEACLLYRRWWLANEVYPVYFVWETGFLEALAQSAERERAADRSRGFFDPVLEHTLGPTVGRPTWDRIKKSAFLASLNRSETNRPGGAALFLSKLAAWFSALPAAKKTTIEMHAVGHSAGSIFHSHFVPALATAFHGVKNAPSPIIKTLAFLAPAVRVDLFKEMLLPEVGRAIGAMAMFTMDQRNEMRDNVAFIYRNSLLYFVRNACEDPTHTTPVLGLDESTRSDADLSALFGLGAGNGRGKADVVWSPTTNITSGRSATQALHHGAFDDDPPTMNSVMRRLLGTADADPLPCPMLPHPDKPVTVAGPDPVTGRELPGVAGASGARRSALCIGIDTYGPQSLTGCVADTQSFGEALRAWGFAVQELTNERATREAITAGMDRILANSSAGDIVVIQYAGHGTQLPDGNGDESDGLDEAWVPYDYNEGEFVIDDDIGGIFDRHRDRGVELVVFTDCCHSGTSTRLFLGPNAPQSSAHSRYMKVPREIEQRYLEKRGAGQAGARFGQADSEGWEIHFAACQDKQSAYEHDGHGDYTRALTAELARAQRASVTYGSLASAIGAAFNGNALQMPQLRALPASLQRELFATARGGMAGSATATATGTANGTAVGAAGAASIPQGTPGDIAVRLDQLGAEIAVLSKKIDALS